MTIKLYTGDALACLAKLPDESVQCVVTSPPYWGLRNYGVSGQLGLEPTPEAYVARMVAVFREVKRVLRDDGTVFLNIGDSYAGGGGYSPDAPSNRNGSFSGNGAGKGGAKTKGVRVPCGLKTKDLVGIPWMLAFALRDLGFYLRADIIWAKPNPMPESVRDRPTKSHEYVFLLTKRARYFYDSVAISEPCVDADAVREYNSDHENLYEMPRKQTRVSVSQSQEGQGRPGGKLQGLRRGLCEGMGANTARPANQEGQRPEIQGQRNGQGGKERLQSFGADEGSEGAVSPDRGRTRVCASLSSNRQAKGCSEEILRARKRQGDDQSLSADSKGTRKPATRSSQAKSSNVTDSLRPDSFPVAGNQGGARRTVRNLQGSETADSRSRHPFIEGRAAHSDERSSPLSKLQQPQEQPLRTRNARSVWTITPRAFRGAHFATFPPALVERCVKAGTSERGACPTCGAPWERVVERIALSEIAVGLDGALPKLRARQAMGLASNRSGLSVSNSHNESTPQSPIIKTLGFRPACTCPEHEPVPCVVLDPFSGAGTVPLVSKQLGRDAIGIDLNPAYNAMARKRIAAVSVPELATRHSPLATL